MTENNAEPINEQPVVDNTEGPVEFGTPHDASNPQPTQDLTENPARPEATEPHPAHETDEDPEQHIGEETSDPWSEDATGSWSPVEVDPPKSDEENAQ